ncbi:RNA polymerase sigma factor [Sphingosinicella soli]|uniref:RNA polymerase sigma-70 factor (ECF subfamily) n=1 Tax=Sphingosinicella soli TaxID=333708 RepID=A0A7W7B6T0_9SPHN|nr:RNA polymerase sigma factor [Sphingosinicella soli]MBB4633917.1 RNA polymerase sigma-70 factor (ECF subfamily) [Sphingosinicella soli]
MYSPSRCLGKWLMKSNSTLDADLRGELIAFLPRLRRYTRSLAAGDEDAGDDLAQSTVAKALASIESFRPGTRLDSWMYRIAQNLWIDTCRTERAKGIAVPEDALEDLMGEDGREVAEMRIDLAATRRAIENLPDDQRAVVMLVLVDGLSYQDASETLGLPMGTVMSRLSRARAMLTEKVFGCQ